MYLHKFFTIFFIFVAAALSNVCTYQWLKYNDEQKAITKGFGRYNKDTLEFEWKTHYEIGQEVVIKEAENFKKKQIEDQKKFNSTPLNPPDPNHRLL
jgi:hypothetical protein